MLQEVRFALRGFQRNPLFTISAAVTIALGIGATTAVFSVVDRILFRPLPLSLVALIAIVVPACAGMRVEPAVTLRAE